MDILTKEIWKDIIGFEGYYQISTLGNVRSLDRVVTHKRGSRTVRKQNMTPCASTFGYTFFCLRINSIPKNFKTHRLIAQAFIPNPENKPQVNHINGIKNDNRIENLEWCTNSENQIHAYSLGLNIAAKGINKFNSKLTDQIVLEAKQKHINENISFAKLAKEYNVSKSAIRHIRSGNSWRHLTGIPI